MGFRKHGGILWPPPALHTTKITSGSDNIPLNDSVESPCITLCFWPFRRYGLPLGKTVNGRRPRWRHWHVSISFLTGFFAATKIAVASWSAAILLRQSRLLPEDFSFRFFFPRLLTVMWHNGFLYTNFCARTYVLTLGVHLSLCLCTICVVTTYYERIRISNVQ